MTLDEWARKHLRVGESHAPDIMGALVFAAKTRSVESEEELTLEWRMGIHPKRLTDEHRTAVNQIWKLYTSACNAESALSRIKDRRRALIG